LALNEHHLHSSANRRRVDELAGVHGLIVGPVGSGKTTGLADGDPAPGGLTGARPGRNSAYALGGVRQTLSQLKMTVLLDLLSWFRYIAAIRFPSYW
jgi:hypothetical protein